MRARIDSRSRIGSLTMSVRYSGQQFARIARAACLLLVGNVMLRLRPAYALQACPRVVDGGGQAASPEQVVRAVRSASRLVGGTCLARALVARTLLARAGVRVTLALGASPTACMPRLQGHAWIEHRGTPVGEGESVPAFAAVWRLPADEVLR